MKTLIILIFAGTMAVSASAVAMTLEEFATKTPEQKVSVLRGRPDRVLADNSHLLRLYSVGLKDSSIEVRRAAAQASVFLVMGLQKAKPLGKSPTFPTQDSADFQQALVELLNHEDKASRFAAVTALAYSSSPTPEVERLLLATINAESNDEIAGGMIESMATAGYDTAAFVTEVSNRFAQTTDLRAAYSAGKVLAHLQPESALDLLISLASQSNPAQRHAVQALGAYGAKASKAKAGLEALMRNPTTPDDIRNLARLSLEAIAANRPVPSNLRPMELTSLWPLVLELPSSGERATSTAAANGPTQTQHTTPQNELTSVKPSEMATAASPDAKSSKPLWWIVGAITALVAVVWIVMRKKKPRA